MVKRTVSVPGPRRLLPLRRRSPRFIGRPESVKEARDWLDRALCVEGTPQETADTALLLLSELASNSVEHAPDRTAAPGDFYVGAHFFHCRVLWKSATPTPGARSCGPSPPTPWPRVGAASFW